jgi:hypothetical protein
METQNGASKITSEIHDKNQIEEQFISPQAFHRTPGGRVHKTTMGEADQNNITTKNKISDRQISQNQTCSHTHTCTKQNGINLRRNQIDPLL